MSIVSTLYASTQASCVIVMPIFHRQHSSCTSRCPVDPILIDSRVDKLNILLSSKLTSLPGSRARFWRCNGFWSNSAKMRTLSSNGVHHSTRGQEGRSGSCSEVRSLVKRYVYFYDNEQVSLGYFITFQVM